MVQREEAEISEMLGIINRALMGHGAFPAVSTKRWRKLLILEGFLEITRPYLLVMGVPAGGMGAFLAPGLLPSPIILAVGGFAVMLAIAGIHSLNDWVDRERDRIVWPNRPIPAGRFPSALGPFFALILMALAIAFTWIFYNPTVSVILGIAEILAIFYCLFLRDKAGYLSLPFIIALFPIGGWAAISPGTLFSSKLPWLLGGLVLTWQAGHIMVYSPAHPIRDENGVLKCEKKALFFFSTPRQSALLGLFFISLLFAESLLLTKAVNLGVFYWCLSLPAGVLSVGTATWLALDPDKRQRAIFAFNAASMFLTFLCGGVVLDMIFRQHLRSFLAWFLSTASSLIIYAEKRIINIENIIYVIGLIITIAVMVFSILGLVRSIMKDEGVRDT